MMPSEPSHPGRDTARLYPFPLWLAWTVMLPLALLCAAGLLVVSADREAVAFDHLEYAWLAGLVPIAGLVLLYGAARRRQAVERFISGRLAPLLVQRISPGKKAARAGLIATAIALLVMGLVGPRWGVYMEEQRVFGRDMVVALDVSRSMLARDVEPNRFARAKREIRQQLTERGSFVHENRLALLAFAGSTSLRMPLTTDTVAFRSKLEQLPIGAAPRGGTAIAEAITATTELFARSPEEAERIILLFTDGEDHEGGPLEAARTAWEEHGIRVYTVGVGDPALTAGAQVPISEEDDRPLLHDGQIVFSKFNDEALRGIARAGGGAYAPVEQLFRLVNRIGSTKRVELAAEERMRHQPRYQWFVAGALLLLMIETLLSEVPGGSRGRSQRGAEGPVDRPLRVWQEEAA